MQSYNAFLIQKMERRRLLAAFPPAYESVKAHHITHELRTQSLKGLFHPARVEVTGIVDDGRGLQALIVRVDGRTHREDGEPYHITWSLDEGADAPEHILAAMIPPREGPAKYEAAHSNALVRLALAGEYAITPVSPPLAIVVAPARIEKPAGANMRVTFLPPPAL